MIYKPEYFDLEELVCPDVFNKFGQQAWSFFDDRFLLTLDTLRRKLNRPDRGMINSKTKSSFFINHSSIMPEG